MPGKHFSGLTPSEQKALYVFVCVLYMKNEFHSISLSTQCGPEAHTLIHCPLSDGPQAHTLHSVWAEGPHSVFTFTE